MPELETSGRTSTSHSSSRRPPRRRALSTLAYERPQYSSVQRSQPSSMLAVHGLYTAMRGSFVHVGAEPFVPEPADDLSPPSEPDSPRASFANSARQPSMSPARGAAFAAARSLAFASFASAGASSFAQAIASTPINAGSVHPATSYGASSPGYDWSSNRSWTWFHAGWPLWITSEPAGSSRPSASSGAPARWISTPVRSSASHSRATALPSLLSAGITHASGLPSAGPFAHVRFAASSTVRVQSSGSRATPCRSDVANASS